MTGQILRCLALASGLLVMHHGAGAQQKSAQAGGNAPASQPAAAGGDQPQATTATFGDWTLRCSTGEIGGQKRRICEVVQSLMVQGQAAPVAQLAFGALASGAPVQMTVVVPANVAFPSTAKVAINDKGEGALDLPWTRCLPAGCFATATPSADLLVRWRTQIENGRLTVVTGANQKVALPMSFRGLAPALDALAREK